MKKDELKKIKETIYNIYYNNEDPKKFYELTGLENYIEELYPIDDSKIIGDWINNKFGLTPFIKKELVNNKLKEISDLFNRVRFYANIPNGKTFKSYIEKFDGIVEEAHNSISGS